MHSHAERGNDQGRSGRPSWILREQARSHRDLVILGERACFVLGLAELRCQFAQQHFSLKHFADDIVGLVAAQADAFKQGIRNIFIRPGANPAATQQAHGQADEVRVFGVGAVVAWVVLEAQGGGQFVGHVPVAHQPRADLFAADTEQVLLDVAVAQVRVDLQVAADQ